jgi:hypothetical protein
MITKPTIEKLKNRFFRLGKHWSKKYDALDFEKNIEDLPEEVFQAFYVSLEHSKLGHLPVKGIVKNMVYDFSSAEEGHNIAKEGHSKSLKNANQREYLTKVMWDCFIEGFQQG